MRDGLPLLGFGLPVSGAWATPAAMVRIARRAEELGYASLWTFQRMLAPVSDDVSRPASDPATRTADDPSYLAVHDALLPLAHVAGHTTRIGLGSATVCAPFTPPALLAKAMTTLDHLSAGRLSVGVGMGWMSQEYDAAGVPFARRGARFEEYLRCLDALWTQDPVEFQGEFYVVPRSHAGLRPVQRPHPPVLVGASAASALRRAGRLAQGWISSTRRDPDGLADAVGLVREGAREAGRDPDALRVLVRVVPEVVDASPGPRRRWGHGTAQEVLDDVASLRTQGATEVLVDLNFSPRVVSPDVDEHDALAYAEMTLEALAPR